MHIACTKMSILTSLLSVTNKGVEDHYRQITDSAMRRHVRKVFAEMLKATCS